MAPCLAVAAAAASGVPAGAQERVLAGGPAAGLDLPGSVADDRDRLAQLLGGADAHGYLLRSPSSRTPVDSAARLRAILPAVHLHWNSALATPGNDGLLWAGRGASALVRGGAEVRAGALRVVLAPEVAVAQNRPFEVFPSNTPGRSPYASPWHTGTRPGDAPMDLPLRFGDRRRTSVSLGQSSVTLTARGAAFGVATENQWWGPGTRNALVLSSAAPGFPHAFVRPARPLRTRLGVVDARLVAGALTQSLFFDTARTRRLRSISAAAVTLTPAALPSLTVGLERAVVRRAASGGDALSHAADALLVWEREPTISDDSARAAGAPPVRRADQLTGVFARFVAPRDGFEAYAEWVRQELPWSLREFLLAPHATQGYVVGVQWLSPRPWRGTRLRLAGEATNVEQTIAIHGRAVRDFYTGFATEEGYTHRGQPLGAATGPGSSMQYVAAGLVAPTWGVDLFGSRVRWENDAMYRQPNPNFYRHDVSMSGGARGVARLPRLDLAAEVVWSGRINYLFQNGFNNPGGVRTVDVHNVALTLSVAPR